MGVDTKPWAIDLFPKRGRIERYVSFGAFSLRFDRAIVYIRFVRY